MADLERDEKEERIMKNREAMISLAAVLAMVLAVAFSGTVGPSECEWKQVPFTLWPRHFMEDIYLPGSHVDTLAILMEFCPSTGIIRLPERYHRWPAPDDLYY